MEIDLQQLEQLARGKRWPKLAVAVLHAAQKLEKENEWLVNQLIGSCPFDGCKRPDTECPECWRNRARQAVESNG